MKFKDWEIYHNARTARIILDKIGQKALRIMNVGKYKMKQAYLDHTSSFPLILFNTQEMPTFTPVITAKLRAWAKGPPERAYTQKKLNLTRLGPSTLQISLYSTTKVLKAKNKDYGGISIPEIFKINNGMFPLILPMKSTSTSYFKREIT